MRPVIRNERNLVSLYDGMLINVPKRIIMFEIEFVNVMMRIVKISKIIVLLYNDLDILAIFLFNL